MKTIKYFIQFDMVETEMSTAIEIGKTEYNKQIKFLTGQIQSTGSYEYNVEEPNTKTFDRGNLIETATYFSCGCATTTLIKQECKDGYYFKNKR